MDASITQGAALSEYCHCNSQTPFRKMPSRYARIDSTVVLIPCEEKALRQSHVMLLI